MTIRVLARSRVAERLDAAGLTVETPALDGLVGYLQLLMTWNRVYNLTGIRDQDELVDRHLIESLALSPLLRGSRVADIGTGAGLPGIPLAAVNPGSHFCLIESRAKRVRFLRHVVGNIGLANVEVRQERVENFRSERPFDTLLARAVAPPAKLLAMTWHLTQPGSLFVFLTSARLEAAWRDLATEHSLQVVTPRVEPRLEQSRVVLLERV